jgi:hypothetical protein
MLFSAFSAVWRFFCLLLTLRPFVRLLPLLRVPFAGGPFAPFRVPFAALPLFRQN